MNGVKENWLKITVGLSSLLVASSIAYYFILVLPQQQTIATREQSQKILLENQKNCAISSNEFLQRENDKNSDRIGLRIIWENSNNFFNDELQLCLLNSNKTIVFNDNIAMEKVIMDIHSNKELFKWRFSIEDGKIVNEISDEKEYEEALFKYFDENK